MASGAANAPLFGWELLRATVQTSLQKDADHIVAFVHWFLVQRAQLGCLGNGNDLKLQDSDVSSELLPADWNIADKSYALRYQLNGKIYVLLGTIAADNIVFNLLSSNNMELSNIQFHVGSTADTIRSVGRQSSADAQAILGRLTDDLLNPVFESTRSNSETQTAAPDDDRRSAPGRIRTPESAPALLRDERFSALRDDRILNDPFAVGRGDLDPFGGAAAGGGMLFNPPMRPGGLGPDIPGHMPGARYDPFGPLGPPQHPRRPDNDHFRPPGFDDYFM